MSLGQNMKENIQGGGKKPPQSLFGEEGELVGNVSSGMCHHSCLESASVSYRPTHACCRQLPSPERDAATGLAGPLAPSPGPRLPMSALE